MEAVIIEGLRFASNLPFAIPHAAATTVEGFHGYRIPAGALVLPNLYAVNHDPAVFPQPNRFLPERFLLRSGGLDRALAARSLPFSTGLRACVGSRLAFGYLFLLFANLLRDFALSLHPDDAANPRLLCPVAAFSLAPAPFRITFAPRRPARRTPFRSL